MNVLGGVVLLAAAGLSLLDSQGQIIVTAKNRTEVFTFDTSGRVVRRQAGKLTWDLLAQ